MTRDELILLVKKIYDVDGTEAEIDNCIKMFDTNVPHPKPIDLIYYPPENKNYTPEEVVDIALSYDRRSNLQQEHERAAEKLRTRCCRYGF